MLRKVSKPSLLALFHGRYGFLRAVQSSSVFMNGLFMALWAFDQYILLIRCIFLE
jgi:hypothetical protein